MNLVGNSRAPDAFDKLCRECGVLALTLFTRMQVEGKLPNSRTLVTALKDCSSLRHSQLDAVRKIHSQATLGGLDSDPFVSSTLIVMYAKSGSLIEARNVFDRISPKLRSVVTWNALVLGYVDHGEENLALQLFSQMVREGCQPSSQTFVALMKACTGLANKEFARRLYDNGSLNLVNIRSLETVMAIHAFAKRTGLETQVFVANTLVDTYSKCGSLLNSCQCFEEMRSRDVVSWTSMIRAYAESGCKEEMALELLEHMCSEGCKPNAVTFVATIKACIALAAREQWTELVHDKHLTKVVALERGMAVQSQAQLSSSEALDSFVLSSLVVLYSKCGSMFDACGVYNKMPLPHVVPLTSLALGYTEGGDATTALELLFSETVPTLDAHAFVAASKACQAMAENEQGTDCQPFCKLRALETCMAIHREAHKRGFDSTTYLTSSLIATYGSCGSVVDAVRTFHARKFQDVFSWTALILSYVQNGEGELGLQAFEVMQRSSAFVPNTQCYGAALRACCAVSTTRSIACDICRRGLEEDITLKGFLSTILCLC